MNGDVAAAEALAAEFEAIRPRLVGVAYGLLGSLGEAEDVVQEAWLRLCRTAYADIEDVTGWLVVTVSRLALDVLRSARVRREEYVGPWLPEPVLEDGDPADRVTLDESMSMAMLVVLESLSPAERTAFVLHDVFGLTFAEVGQVVGRTPAACRQLAARARGHVRGRAPRFAVDQDEHRKVVDAFAGACAGEDLRALLSLLDPDVVLRSDGGGLAKAARRPLHGPDRVSRFLVGVVRRYTSRQLVLAPTSVNGWAGLCGTRDGRLKFVIGLAVADGRITEIYMVTNPEKLGNLT
ncbi:RNA polymerase sigma factor SigJ [Sinosporangium siamense]|uniref:RNA polymerase sigma factor SigJ n=1 Tax=Sinosporangium siamense TaxID=1367973 RepID=UPI0035EB7498